MWVIFGHGTRSFVEIVSVASGFDSRMITKRTFVKTAFGVIAAAPVARIIALKTMDSPLAIVHSPELTLVDGWLLDTQDTKVGMQE